MTALPFRLADELVAEPDEPSDYLIEQFAIREAITSFSAQIKAGKTTFIGAALRAMFAGEPIIGFKTRPATVLYCTEEGPKTFKRFLQRTGLTDTGGQLHVLFLSDVPRVYPWRTTADNVNGYAREVNADLVIFDTLTRWAKIKPDQENDAGAAAEAMAPLETLRASKLAVVAVFHDRKSGGDVADSFRGSSAFGGAADILFNLTNPGTHGHPNRRQLQSVGRFDDPGTWVMDWHADAGSYELVAEGSEAEKGQVERGAMRDRIMSVMTTWLMLDGPSLAKECDTESGAGTFRRALGDLVKEGRITESGGSGRGKGNGKVYTVVL